MISCQINFMLLKPLVFYACQYVLLFYFYFIFSQIHRKDQVMKKDKFVLPLELKTGKQTNSIEHRSQVSRLFSVLCFHKRKFPFQLVRFCQFLISILVCQLLYDSLKIYGDYSNFILIVEYCTLFIVLYSKVCFHPLCVTSFSQL